MAQNNLAGSASTCTLRPPRILCGLHTEDLKKEYSAGCTENIVLIARRILCGLHTKELKTEYCGDCTEELKTLSPAHKTFAALQMCLLSASNAAELLKTLQILNAQ